jgi:RNA polymerase sigma-70 factor (ECF subfamily)
VPGDIDPAIARLYRAEWGRVLATLIRLTGDFTLAEEAAQDAFEAALHRWREHGVPEHPRAWLIQTGRFYAIDRLRRVKRLAAKLEGHPDPEADETARWPEPVEIPDDLLRLMFTCCHPALALETQVALALRTLVGLETEEIARAFVVAPTTMAQRLVRAKKKIAVARIPYAIPEAKELPDRLHGVLTVLYLLFNEGYAATRGPDILRTELSAEAIRLVRVVRSLFGDPPPGEVTGLLALMLLHDSRRAARVDLAGDIVRLEDQDRSRWDSGQIAEALPLAAQALAGNPGPFGLQAGIAAVHARARSKEDTDWAEILRLYDRLVAIDPSPIVRLNRAVAVAMIGDPGGALAIVDEIERGGALDGYHLLHVARAEFSERLGRRAEAQRSFAQAMELATNESERRFLARRLAGLSEGAPHG